MKKGILFVLILLIVYVNVYCDDIVYVVTQDSPLREDGYDTAYITSNASVGETVFFEGEILHSNTEYGEHFIEVKKEGRGSGFIDARHILLKDNQSLPASITDKIWIPSYYQFFLRGMEKEKLFYFEPYWLSEERKEFVDRVPYSLPWEDEAGNTCYYIHNNVIRISALDTFTFITINQQYKLDDVTLTVRCLKKSDFSAKDSLSVLFNKGETYTLNLRIDGDYMDVFVNGNKEKIATLIGVDKYYFDSINKYFRGEKIDMSKIKWAKRANGSMDAFPEIVLDNTPSQQTIEAIDVFDENENQDNINLRKNNERRSVPLWILFSTASLAVVAVGTVFFIKKKK